MSSTVELDVWINGGWPDLINYNIRFLYRV